MHLAFKSGTDPQISIYHYESVTHNQNYKRINSQTDRPNLISTTVSESGGHISVLVLFIWFEHIFLYINIQWV